MNKRVKNILLLSSGCLMVGSVSAQQLFSAHSLMDDRTEFSVSDLSGTADFAIDKKEATAYEATDGRNTWLQVKLSSPMVVTGYTLVSNNDAKKDPKTWTLKGSNDGQTWVDIVSEGGVVFDHRYQVKSFSTTLGVTNTAYQYIRLHIMRSSISAQNGPVQVGDWQLFGYSPTNVLDITDNGGVITAQYAGDEGANETIQNVIDNDLKNKYTNKVGSVWVQYESSVPVLAASYKITSPQLNFNRNPRSWVLMGSNDGATWNELDVQINRTFYDIPYNQMYFKLSPDEQKKEYNWSDYAETAQNTLYSSYWEPSQYYYIQEVNPVHSGYNYWWNAHVMDALADGYRRTKKTKYLDRMTMLRSGVFAKCQSSSTSKWWNTFYDDMEWMGLATLNAYQATGNEEWKTATVELWNMIKGGWTDVHGGGIMWASGSPNSKNACSNGPAMTLAAKLYKLTGEKTYLDWAVKIHDFMMDKLVNPDWGGLVRDGIGNETLSWTFTYNQGTFMAGCVELYLITKDQKYLDEATRIVDIVTNPLNPIRRFAPGGVVSIEGTGDGGLFKGIMMRYIQQLIRYQILDEERQQRCIQFFLDNGKSIYDCALIRPEMVFCTNWSNRLPVTTKRDMSVHVSGTMMFELLDEMNREGLLQEYRLERMKENRTKSYRYFKLQIMTNGGDDRIQLGELQLFDKDQDMSHIKPIESSLPLEVFSRDSEIVIRSKNDNKFDYMIYSNDGQYLQGEKNIRGEGVVKMDQKGIYHVQTITGREQLSTKVITK